jgi:hypothetical protein
VPAPWRLPRGRFGALLTADPAGRERCVQPLGVDLATVRELAAKVEPFVRADGTRIWSLMQLERQLRPEAARPAARWPPRPPAHSGHRWMGLSASSALLGRSRHICTTSGT